MDYYAVNNYNLPIELMMESASLQLANLIAGFTKKDQLIKIGIGNDHNGGGGLVTARRLPAWSGVPAHGNQRSEWDAGCRFDHPNPLYR